FPPTLQLPDEIIKEVLTPALHVPDKPFADLSPRSSPFSSYELSSSAMLLVCKAWLRVATPLLYETVVMRSKAQAQGLASALQGNPQLCYFIKKLRIEGGYGTSIHTILKQSLGVTDLWLSVALWSNESIGGYSKGFALIRPHRLIIVDDGHSKSHTIRNALGEAVEKHWDTLITVIIDANVYPIEPSLRRQASLRLPSNIWAFIQYGIYQNHLSHYSQYLR
ncbi:hypothetical protein BKA70DRAFT_191998, partial [Coprinopsis sp. MPI-PUGE-AT-0042]